MKKIAIVCCLFAAVFFLTSSFGTGVSSRNSEDREQKTKTILIVEPASSGLNLIPTAKKRGLRVIVLSANEGQRIVPDKFRPYIDHLITVETNNLELMKTEVEKLGENISAVIPGFEHFVESATILANSLPTDFKEQVAGMDYYLLEPGKNSYASLKGLKELKRLSSFKEFQIIHQAGQYVPPQKDYSARVAYSIFIIWKETAKNLKILK